MRFDDSLAIETSERRPDHWAADAEPVAEVELGRQPDTRREIAAVDQTAYLQVDLIWQRNLLRR